MKRLIPERSALSHTCAIALIFMASHIQADEFPIEYTKPKKLAELEKDDIIESSGLIASHHSKDCFWTHNDSGGKSRLFAFNRLGKHLGTCKIEGAGVVDWEDIAAANVDKLPFLIIGDVGDNRRRRESCMLYFVLEPINPKTDVRLRNEVTFVYETGPVDCEAIAFDPQRRSILLSEKTRLGSFRAGRVFELTLPPSAFAPQAISNSQTETKPRIAKLVGSTKLPTTTAMDISRDGRFLVIGSYLQALAYERKANESWSEVLAGGGTLVHLPARRQGETICFGHKSYNLFLTSEKRPTPFFEIKAKRRESSSAPKNPQ